MNSLILEILPGTSRNSEGKTADRSKLTICQTVIMDSHGYMQTPLICKFLQLVSKHLCCNIYTHTTISCMFSHETNLSS